MADERIGLHSLKPAPGSRKPRKRIGRGEGSGTARPRAAATRARARARAAQAARSNFEGGQTPIHMRMRKLRGPHMKKSMPFEQFRTQTQPVNLRRPRGALRRRRRGDARTRCATAASRRASEVPVKILGAGRARRRRSPCTPTASRRRPARRSRPRAAPAQLIEEYGPRAQDRSSNAFRVPEIRKKLAFTARDARALPARRATSPRRASTPTRSRQISNNFARLEHPRLPEPLLAAARSSGSRSSRSGSCRTSRPRSSCSCSRSWCPSLEKLQQGGRGRPAEDHAVHALPDRRRSPFGQSIGYVFLFRTFAAQAGTDVVKQLHVRRASS